jgi:hypothetical protein
MFQYRWIPDISVIGKVLVNVPQDLKQRVSNDLPRLGKRINDVSREHM